MGVFQDVAGPALQQYQQLGFGSQIGVAVVGSLVLIVVLNVLNQILFHNPNEPPMVFHWFPLVGSTITYGMDPPKFFKDNRKKVCALGPELRSRVQG